MIITIIIHSSSIVVAVAAVINIAVINTII